MLNKNHDHEDLLEWNAFNLSCIRNKILDFHLCKEKKVLQNTFVLQILNT